MIIWTTCKAVSFFSNIARVQYSIIPLIYIYIYFYRVGEVCTDIAPTNSRANFIKNDFDQETGQYYSTVVQIIVEKRCVTLG